MQAPLYNSEEFSFTMHGASGEKWTSRESLYVVAGMSARDIYDRGSVSPGGEAQNNASRAYSMRLVARDACGAILLARLAKITCALPADA